MQARLAVLRASMTVPPEVLKEVAYESYPVANPRMLEGDKEGRYVEVEGGRSVDDVHIAAIATELWKADLDVQVRWRDGTMEFFPLSGKGPTPSSSREDRLIK